MLKLNFVTIQDKIYINKKNRGKINAYLYKQNNCMYILFGFLVLKKAMATMTSLFPYSRI